MKHLGGIELPRKRYVGRSRKTGAIGARESGAGGRQRKRYYARGGQFATILKRQNFLAATTKRLDLNIYIVGAGALIPYKRGIDDVGWFKCYRHS